MNIDREAVSKAPFSLIAPKSPKGDFMTYCLLEEEAVLKEGCGFI
jgi:hypothetical protein